MVSVSGQSSCGTTNFDGKSSGSIQLTSSTSKFCTYNIANRGSVVKLRWRTFNVPGTMPYCNNEGYVEVYIGCGAASRSLIRFCSTNMKTLPHDIYARDGCMKIVMSTNGIANVRADFESRDQSRSYFSGDCSLSKDYWSSSGVIASPNWPQYYTDSDFPYSGSACEWDIKLSDTSKVIKVSFMDVDVYSYSSSCRYDEVLTLKGKKSVLTSRKEERTYCKKDPFSLITKYYDIEVELDINRNRPTYRNRGFAMGWVAYTDEQAKANTKWGMYAGIAVILIIAFIITFCVYRRCKNRRSTTTHTTTTNYGASTTVTQPMMQPAYPTQDGPKPFPQPGYQPQNYQPGYPPQQNYPPPYTAGQQAPYPQGGQPAYPPPVNQYPVGQPAPYPQAGQPALYPQAGQPAPYPQDGQPAQYPAAGYMDQAPPPYSGPYDEKSAGSAPPMAQQPYPPQ